MYLKNKIPESHLWNLNILPVEQVSDAMFTAEKILLKNELMLSQSPTLLLIQNGSIVVYILL